MKNQKYSTTSAAGTTFPAVFFLLMLSGLLLLACSGEEKEAQAHSTENAREMTIPVEGMSCNSCVANVKSTLKPMEGVEKVAVSLEERSATLTYDPEKITPAQVQQAINKLGYKAGEPVIETNH